MTTDAELAMLHPTDAAAARALGEVRAAYANDNRWWQNASFALPLLVTLVSLAAGVVFHSTEGIGFGIFGAVVTLLMVPVVLFTWRSTATAIVLTTSGAAALHRGRVLHALDWSDLHRIEVVEYLGNKRYKLVHGEDEYLTVENEIEGAADLVEQAFALSGVPRQQPPGGAH